MPVDENIDLRKEMTDGHFKKLDKQAEEAKKKAQEIEDALERANRAHQNILGVTAGVSYDKRYKPDPNEYDKSTLDRNVSDVPKGGVNPIGGMGGSLGHQGMPFKGRRSGQGKENAPIAGIRLDNVEIHLEELRDLAKEHKNELNEVKRKQMEADMHKQQIISNTGKGFGKVNQGFAFARNPMSFGMQQGMKLLGKATIVGAIAAMVIEQVQAIYQQILDQIKDMYAPGGALDVRKDMLNAVKQVVELETLIDMEQGRIFFTSATGEFMRQGVPQSTNTNRRVNGFKQYLQEYER